MSVVSLPELSSLPESSRQAISRLVAPVNVALVSAHSPALPGPMVDYALAVLDQLRLAPRHRELLIMTVADRCHSPYLRVLHDDYARSVGLSEDDLAGPRPDDQPDPVSALVVRAGIELLDTATISPATAERLVEVLSEQEVVEICCAIGYYRLLASLANATGIPADNQAKLAAVAQRAEDALRAAAD
jgi:4-carboxymuconolactone decarboxylase